MTFSEAKQTFEPTRNGAEIGILLYPNSQLAAVHGLTDLFAPRMPFTSRGVGCLAARFRSATGDLTKSRGASDESTRPIPGAPKSSQLSFFRRVWGFQAAAILYGSDFAVG
jgi:hypothetical protein